LQILRVICYKGLQAWHYSAPLAILTGDST
jgi:hypothetical protein